MYSKQFIHKIHKRKLPSKFSIPATHLINNINSNISKQQYKRNDYVSIVELLRLRGGSDDGSDDGASENSSKRRRRRRKKVLESSSESTVGTTNIQSTEDIADANEEDPKSGTKKKKRRRRVQNVDETDTILQKDDSSSIHSLDLEEVESDSTSLNTPVMNRKRKRRRKIDITKEEEVKYVASGDDGKAVNDELTESTISNDISINDKLSEASESGSSTTPAERVKKKKRRRRKQMNDIDITAADDESVEKDESTSQITTIDTTITIPNEEIVPESIDTSISIEENVLTPEDRIAIDNKEDGGDQNMESVLVANDDSQQIENSSEGDHIEDTIADAENTEVDDEVDTSTRDGIEDTDNEVLDSHESLASSVTDDGDLLLEDVTKTEEEESPVQTQLSIDASIDLPNEEIVPESIDSTVEFDNNIEIEPMETTDNVATTNLDMTVTTNKETSDETSDDVDAIEEDSEIIPKEDNVSEEELGEEEEEVTGVETSELHETLDIEQSTDGIESDDEEIQEDEINPHDVNEEETNEGSTTIIIEEDTDLDVGDEDLSPPDEKEVEVDDTSSAETQDVSTKTDRSVEEATTIDELEVDKMDDDCLTMSIVTWNLAESAPPEKDTSFFKQFRKDSNGVGSDLVMINAQECEEIKPRRTEGHRSRHIRRMGIMMLGKEYVPLAIHSLGGIQCAFYCHRDMLGDIEMINLADVTCGVGNVLHNKGAIGIYLKVKRKTKRSRMLLVTGHLAAHVNNVDARNNDYKRIISELEVQAPTRFLRPKRNRDSSPVDCDGSYLLNSVDHVFFAGDLNYRIDLPREYVEHCIINIQQCRSKGTRDEQTKTKWMKKLLRRDQLLQTISSGRAFTDFNEGKITFLPTFKFDKGTSNYDTSHKQRVPAWTDRILFKTRSKVNVLDYRSIPKARHSDHRAVVGTYQLGWGIDEKLANNKSKKKKRRSSSRRRRRDL